MKRSIAVVALLGVAALVGWSLAQQPAARPQPAGAAAPPPEETAIREAATGYTAAFNKGDADALGAFWTEDAEYFGDDGTTVKGRAAIVGRFKTLFADKQGLIMKVTPTMIKLLGSSAALVDGTATLTEPKLGTSAVPFEAAWVKEADGRWRLSRVRDLSELSDEDDSNYGRLKELEWLVGDWTSEAATVSVAMTSKWNKNKNFLIVDQTVKVGGKDAVTVMKVIGWDPVEGHIRSWVFDSEGGFGSGIWSRAGNEWTEESEFRTRAGTDGSAVNVWRFVDENQFEWKAGNREVDGQPLPDAAVKYTRKAAAK